MSGARKAPGRGAAGPMNEEGRWQEVVRRYRAGESLRSIATAMGTNPRRLRRALARAGIRAHGKDLGASGLSELAPYRARLGREPDEVIARAAGVTPEAVQGERRRLRIAAFRPLPKVTLSPAEEDWVRGPARAPVRRRRVEDGAAVVVVKPTRDGASALRRITERVPEVQPVVGTRLEGAGPRLPLGVVAFRANESGSAPSAPSPLPTLPPLDSRRAETPLSEPSRRMVRSSFFYSERPELPILPPKVDRGERRRIVRADAPMLEPAPPPPVAPAAPARRSRGPAWRPADPEVVRQLVTEAEQAAAARAAEEAARVAAEVAASAQRARDEAAAAALAAQRAQREAAEREAAAEARRAARAAASEAAGPPPADPFASEEAGVPCWEIRVEGIGAPLHVHGADVVEALAYAGRALSGLRVLSIQVVQV